jgi:amino-acid N-acetyltransferase
MKTGAGISSKPTLAGAKALLSSAQLPTEDLHESHCEYFFYSGSAERPTGLVGLELFGEVALLRSLVVAAGHRGSGEGAALLAHAESQARAQGVRELYLLTNTAEAFFARRGYTRSARDSAPDAIRTTREFASICPSSAALMMRNLDRINP